MAKGNRTTSDFNHPVNKNRAETKKARGKGRLAMDKMSLAEWTKEHDPLYGVKGIERYQKLKEIKH